MPSSSHTAPVTGAATPLLVISGSKGGGTTETQPSRVETEHEQDGIAGLPSENPTKSYWLRDLSPVLEGHRTTEELPAEADVVIVGSGVTGAFAGWFLKMGVDLETEIETEQGEGLDEKKHDRSVVVLEAREVCSGATGRNGGHCQPQVYFSPSTAEFELETYNFLEGLIKKHNIPCDWISQTGVHAYLSQDIFDLAQEKVEQLKKTHPHLASQVTVIKPGNPDPNSNSNTIDNPTHNEANGEINTEKATLSSLRIPHAKGAFLQQHAASVWPYRLVSWLFEHLLSRFPPEEFNLQTNTPVTSLRRYISPKSTTSSTAGRHGPGVNRWILSTPRGDIIANKVILATNGYTSHLLPKMSNLIVPVRGQMAALLPPAPAPGSTPPRNTGNSSQRDNKDTFFADNSGIKKKQQEENNSTAMTDNDNNAETEIAELEHAYIFLASGEGGADEGYNTKDDHVIQRPVYVLSPKSRKPKGGGEFIFGGGRDFASPDKGVGDWRDDILDEDVAKYLRGHLSPPLDLHIHPGTDTGTGNSNPSSTDIEIGGKALLLERELRATHQWTGIMGFTRDQHPLVGPVPSSLLPSIVTETDNSEEQQQEQQQEKQNQESERHREGEGKGEGEGEGKGEGEGIWICAGYNGHGMPVAALSARTIVEQISSMRDGSPGRVRLPTEFELTEERVRFCRENRPTIRETDQLGWSALLLNH